MLRRFYYIIFCLVILGQANAQSEFGNEWIKDYNKKYYAIQVGKDGLYRITYDALKKLGIDDEPINIDGEEEL